jgi:hypothetical protein
MEPAAAGAELLYFSDCFFVLLVWYICWGVRTNGN